MNQTKEHCIQETYLINVPDFQMMMMKEENAMPQPTLVLSLSYSFFSSVELQCKMGSSCSGCVFKQILVGFFPSKNQESQLGLEPTSNCMVPKSPSFFSNYTFRVFRKKKIPCLLKLYICLFLMVQIPLYGNHR